MEKGRILIVEDEAIIAMEIESQLQSLGYWGEQICLRSYFNCKPAMS